MHVLNHAEMQSETREVQGFGAKSCARIFERLESFLVYLRLKVQKKQVLSFGLCGRFL